MIITALTLSGIWVSAETSPSNATPNRLLSEQSPYLQQHAYNPVDWFPWCDEAFEKAKTEGKVVLLSIGYSTCHWCHVMNRESFSNPKIADYLNEHFVCIKVDREERPDIDGVYMNFVQQLTGSGGWPLNVWLTPDRKPFFGGTYFPPDRSRGTQGATFPELLTRIYDMWKTDQGSVIERSEQMVIALNDFASQSTSHSSGEIEIGLISAAIESFQNAFIERTGAFGAGPNFPSAANLSFLLKTSVVKEVSDVQREKARQMALASLNAIMTGGIQDHIGGGFHRDTVDGEWKLPHYEKMLYDEATLIKAYVDAWKSTRDDKYREVIIKTSEYLLRDIRHAQGAFFSAEDAESYESSEARVKREGAFYVWSSEELNTALNDDHLASIAHSYYTLSENGNAPSGPFNTTEVEGYNTLRIEKSIADLAGEFQLFETEIDAKLDLIKTTLFIARAERPRPHLDDKIITSWNGLAISALSQAAQTLGKPEYAQAATEAAQFIRSNLFNAKNGQLTRLYRNAPSTVEAFSDDYAYLIEGLVDLYEATADPQWLEWANTLQETQIALFYDEKNGGFFGFQASDEIVFNRSKDGFDGAIPSANSTSSKNLARLGQFFDNSDYSDKAKQSILSFLPSIADAPMRMPALLEAALYVIKKPIQIVVAENPGSTTMKTIASEILLPNRLLFHADAGASQRFLGKHLPFIQRTQAIEGKPTVYVCENFVCQLPARSPEALKKQLAHLLQ